VRADQCLRPAIEEKDEGGDDPKHQRLGGETYW
jgi:hypothetical protein